MIADINILYKGTQQLIESKKVTDKISNQIKGLKGEEIKVLQKEINAVQDTIKSVQDLIFGKQNPK